MKVSEIIQEFVPCEICGNNDLKNFYFHVIEDTDAYVKCCECEEEYYSISARNILARTKESRKARIGTRITLQNRNHESVHPLIKVLARV